jgi:hypothetical protein
MAEPNMLYKIFELRLLSEDNLDNDAYFIQYLAYILKYIERKNKNKNSIAVLDLKYNEHKNSITYFGLKSVEFDVGHVYKKFVNESQKEEKVTQNELIKFCLYMSNANKICEKMENIIALYKQDKNTFRRHSKLPDCVLNDFISFEDRIHNLSILFKKIADGYSDSLSPKHTIAYNQQKTKSFLTE